MKTFINIIFLAALIISCQKEAYKERSLPTLAMNVPEVVQLDSVELSARILDIGFSEVRIAKKGFVLAAEGFGQEWAPMNPEKSWELAGVETDALAFSAAKGDLPLPADGASGRFEAVPFLDIDLDGSNSRRVYGTEKAFFLEGIQQVVSITEANHQIILDFNLEASGAPLGENGLCWVISENQKESGFNFQLENTPEENVIQNPPSEMTIQFPLGKYIYLRPYAYFKGEIYYGAIEEIFIGNYWETIKEEDYLSSSYPEQLYGTAGFSLNGRGYVFGGRTVIGNDDPIQSTLWEYNPESKEWRIAGTLPTSDAGEPGGRRDATAFVINDKAYIGLGRDVDRNEVYQSFFEYTPETGFREVASYPQPAYRAVCFVIGEKAYVGTGAGPNNSSYFSFYAFDPNGTDINGLPVGSWQEVSALPIAVAGAVGFSIGDKGYVGTGYSSQTATLHQEFYEFDPGNGVMGAWIAVAPYGGSARQIAIAFVVNGKAYVGGGANYATGLLLADYKDFWEFEPGRNNWNRVEDIGLFLRSAAASFTVEEKGFVYGGYLQSGVITSTSSVDIYTPDK